MRLARELSVAVALAILGCEVPEPLLGGEAPPIHGLEPAPNPTGLAASVHASGAIDRANPFFLPLGTNGRTCESCHDARAGWSLTPGLVQERFEASNGLDPLFNTHDVGSRADADTTTRGAQLETFRTVLAKGLIRLRRTLPATAEFTVLSVDDPHGGSTPEVFASFRRSSTIANERLASSASRTSGPHDVPTQLASAMNGATRSHGQRSDEVPPEQREAGARFMLDLYFAQAADAVAGPLDAAGARGGPLALSQQEFYLGINDLQGRDPQGRPFSPVIFDLFDAWAGVDQHPRATERDRKRAAVARGQALFNTREFDLTSVAGLNDELGQDVLRGTCGTCHNAPNVGTHSVFRLMNTGTASGERRPADLPLLTVRHKLTQQVLQTTDLGRAASSGKWSDIGKFRVPSLRGLAARAPYFHSGSAATVREVLQFYEARFALALSDSEREDLEAFLLAL